MLKPEAFLAIEASVSATVHSAVATKLAAGLEPITEFVANGKFDDAHGEVDKLSLLFTLQDKRKRLEELAISAVLFGAHNLTGDLTRTSFVRSKEPIPSETALAINQLIHGIEMAGAELLRDNTHLEIERLAMEGQGPAVSFMKSDLADRLNEAVMKQGRVMADVGANLTTSRLVSLGFIAEAVKREVTSYQINEVLDSRTCPVCRYMHGKTFSVASERTRLISTLGTSDPQELRSLAPWPSQTKEGLQKLYSMDAGEMQAAGYGSPPYHPGCRGMLTRMGSVTEEIPTKVSVPNILPATSLSPTVETTPANTVVLSGAVDELTVLNDALAVVTDEKLAARVKTAIAKGRLSRARRLLEDAGVIAAK